MLATHWLCGRGDTAHISVSRAWTPATVARAQVGHTRCCVPAAPLLRRAVAQRTLLCRRMAWTQILPVPRSPRRLSQSVGGLGTGAQDTGAQLLGPSVAPLLPWGRPGKADPVSPSCGPPFPPRASAGTQPGGPHGFLAPGWLPLAHLRLASSSEASPGGIAHRVLRGKKFCGKFWAKQISMGRIVSPCPQNIYIEVLTPKPQDPRA